MVSYLIQKAIEILKDNTGSGAAEMITVVVKIIFVVSAGAAIVGILQTATGETFTNMMNHLKDMGNSGY